MLVITSETTINWGANKFLNPLLFVNMTGDERIPRDRAETLHAAAGDPHVVEWYDGGHSEVPGAALKRMLGFLREHLGA